MLLTESEKRSLQEVKEVEIVGRKKHQESYRISLDLVSRIERELVSERRRVYKVEGESYNLTQSVAKEILNLKGRGDNILNPGSLKVKGEDLSKLKYNERNVYTLKKEIKKKEGELERIDLIYLKRYGGNEYVDKKSNELSEGIDEMKPLIRTRVKRLIEVPEKYGVSEYYLSYREKLKEKSKENSEAPKEEVKKDLSLSEKEYESYQKTYARSYTYESQIESQLLEVEGRYYRLIRERHKID